VEKRNCHGHSAKSSPGSVCPGPARRARLADASEEAGYAVGGAHGGRLASMPEGADRIAELHGP
jgi:hypothetical protein